MSTELPTEMVDEGLWRARQHRDRMAELCKKYGAEYP